MYTVKIKPHILEHRLDCGFYNPVGLAATTKLNSTMEVNKLSELVDQRRKITNGVRGPEWATSKFKLIRLQDCEHWIVNSDAAASITKRQFDENRRCKLQANDIVVAIGGYIGNAAVVVDECDAVIGQHSAVLPEPEQTGADSRFLVAYLNSRFAEAIFSRYVSGTVQAGINLEDLRDLPAPKPNGAAQKYIGDKVRQAEQLRTWGKIQYDTATSLFDKLVSEFGYVSRPNKQCVWAKLDNRLDPAYYAPQYSFLNERWFTSRCKPLSTYIEDGAYGVLPDSNSYGSGDQKFIRATDIKLSNIDPTAFTFVPADQVTLKARVKTNDILLEIKGAIEACELAGRDLEGTYVNGSVYRFTPKEIAPGYLAFYLRSFVKQLYCQRVSVNNIISYLDLGSISNLPVVRLGQENEYLIEQSFLQQLDAARLSFRLTTAAKFLVEALIEGLITETEVNAAEQALQTGNDQPDRLILNRLKTDGVDGNGQPLFADLDQLYNLLEQAGEQ